ncbi:hypothetical protein HHSLTHF2_20240 [Vreelandella venusta]|uniref:Uncharacterized protein n=1 Tax=Halomonas hydrothermalis TaxID=115561 RepID=A0A6F8U4M1_9GAMM|nr:hypothetical protein [Halomonas hydrothermalis]BCB08134.1 hypothetical protein HHSLTHF2_20240 [Halomonas hydrothermalis]
MATFFFAFRDNETNNLVEVRTVADNQEKALKAFKLKAPAIDVSRIEQVNGQPIGASEKEILASQSAVKKDALPVSETSDKNQILGWIGCLFIAVGFYFLLIDPGSGNIANLQKLNIGQTCSIIGAIFVAAEWRPR